MACALPADEFRIMLAPHPNIRAQHSRWQFAQYLADATRAGVHIPEDVDDWRAGLVACDLVVGDHSSVAFYGAALGRPLLLATTPSQTVDPDSPIAHMLSAGNRLDPNGDLEEQIRRACADNSFERFAGIVDQTTSVPDQSPALLRAAMYHTLGLPEPVEAATATMLPAAAPLSSTGAAHIVAVTPHGDRKAAIVRYPAERLNTGLPSTAGTHLAVDLRQPDLALTGLADLLIGTLGPDAREWIEGTLSEIPGCLVAAVPIAPGRWLIGDRRMLFEATGTDQACCRFASIVTHNSDCDNETLTGTWRIDCADRTYTVTVTRTR
ncbi:hypothetical protein D7D52_32390 [Nocardia yunnanensis]|uniref:Uncharacterized protein n=1 Tax=Nocardia yunnanensis TaxID=2382165 RepID=A0A386ZKS2_9NOCA|nr:hypothetical protein D7D52_32390 [Nocardia yunnanensis]